jgi:hypothetical protein
MAVLIWRDLRRQYVLSSSSFDLRFWDLISYSHMSFVDKNCCPCPLNEFWLLKLSCGVLFL